MAHSSIGFNGTVSEIQWSTLAPLLGNGDCVAASGHLAASQVAGFRRVLIQPGTAQAHGIATTISPAESPAADMPAPAAGQFHLVVLRRVWATKVTSILTIPHTTTTSATPSAPPTTFPAAMFSNPGVQDDQPLYWAWVNVSTTNVNLFDLRTVPVALRIAAAEADVDALQSRATNVENRTTSTEGRLDTAERGTFTASSPGQRDSYFPSGPIQGDRVFRSDTGGLESYYQPFNATTNSRGADPAGWYPTEDTGTEAVYAALKNGIVSVVNNNTLVAVNSGTFTMQREGRILFVTTLTTSQTGNAAGYLQLFINGVQIGPGVRIASLGTASPMAWTRAIKAAVKVGINSFDVRVAAESGGTGYQVTNQVVEIWRD